MKQMKLILSMLLIITMIAMTACSSNSSNASNPPANSPDTEAQAGSENQEEETTPSPEPSPEPPVEPIFTKGTNDEFNTASLESQWTWIRENDSNWSLEERSGYMRIVSEDGDIAGSRDDARNILLTGAPDGDWTIATKLDGKPDSQWSQGGLVVYMNDNTYLRATRLFGEGNQFQFDTQLSAIREHEEVPDAIESTEAYLKVEKKGDTYRAYYSADGVEYTQIGTERTAELTDLKIGLIACGGTGLTVDFDYFHIATSESASAPWNFIDDEMDDYTANWNITGNGGSVMQNEGYVTVVDDAEGYNFLTLKDFAAPSGAFAFEARAKANAPDTTNEISIRSDAYLISLFLTYGTTGTAQDREANPVNTVTLDTTVYHDYRIVVHDDYTYDLYVDGVLQWSGATSSGSGGDILKIGGSGNNGITADLNVEYFRMGSGVLAPAGQ